MSALPSPGLDAMGVQLTALRSAQESARNYLLRAKPEPKPQPAQWQSYWHIKQKEKK